MLNGKQHSEQVKLTLLLLRQGLSNTHKIHEQYLKELHSPNLEWKQPQMLSFYSVQLQIKKLRTEVVKPVVKWELRETQYFYLTSGNLMTKDSCQPKNLPQHQEKMKLGKVHFTHILFGKNTSSFKGCCPTKIPAQFFAVSYLCEIITNLGFEDHELICVLTVTSVIVHHEPLHE